MTRISDAPNDHQTKIIIMDLEKTKKLLDLQVDMA